MLSFEWWPGVTISVGIVGFDLCAALVSSSFEQISKRDDFVSSVSTHDVISIVISENSQLTVCLKTGRHRVSSNSIHGDGGLS